MSQGWEMMPWYVMILGPIMMILMLATVVTVVVLLVRWFSGGFSPGNGPLHPPHRTQRRALDILEERFARGEIDKDEFEAKRRILLDQ